MCCSTARHYWALTRSNHPHSHEYTDMQPFVMQHFQGCRASLESLCINFGGELSTIATLMFAVLHMLLNSSTLFSHDQKYPSTPMWIHKYVTLCNAPFSRMQSIHRKFIHQFWGWAVHHCYTNVCSAACATQWFGTFFDFSIEFTRFFSFNNFEIFIKSRWLVH